MLYAKADYLGTHVWEGGDSFVRAGFSLLVEITGATSLFLACTVYKPFLGLTLLLTCPARVLALQMKGRFMYSQKNLHQTYVWENVHSAYILHKSTFWTKDIYLAVL